MDRRMADELDRHITGNYGEDSIEKEPETEIWRAPELADDDIEEFSECGRILGSTDYTSHWYKIVTNNRFIYLLVRHGAGDARIQLSYPHKADFLKGFDTADSDTRYLMMSVLYGVYSDAKRAGIEDTSHKYRKAFAEGRLKKRKIRNRDACKIWIEAA